MRRVPLEIPAQKYDLEVYEDEAGKDGSHFQRNKFIKNRMNNRRKKT